MKIIFFKAPIKITSSKELQKITGIKEFFFEKDASVIFERKISLSPRIHYGYI